MEYLVLRDVHNEKMGNFVKFEAENFIDCIEQYLRYEGKDFNVAIIALRKFNVEEVKMAIDYANMFLRESNKICEILVPKYFAKPSGGIT